MPVFGIQPANLLQIIFEEIGTAVAVVDRQEQVVFANRTALALFGMQEGNVQVNFQDWRQNYRIENSLGHEISFDDSAIIRALKGEHVESEEVRVTLPDGTRKWLLAWAYPFSVAGLSGVLAIVVDQTTEVRLRRTATQLQRMETLGAIAAGLTHDFNNILDTILLNAELALREATQDCRPRLEQIIAASKKASQMINRLMQFSRTQDFQIQPLQINDIVQEVLHLLEPLLRKDTSVRTNLFPGLSPIQASHAQLEQLLMNLIVNALDAMPDGGRLTISTAPGEITGGADTKTYQPAITITVADTGAGIHPDLQSVIFDPFFTTKPAGKGSGLGLATVYGIVQQLHGTINVRSAPGAGAAFVISLPV